jgi:type IV pilus assembly protein PilC
VVPSAVQCPGDVVLVHVRETGELDTMLYKVADNYDEEVAVLTESLVSLLEPLMIVVLGGIVGFIVIALFMPLISIIQELA